MRRRLLVLTALGLAGIAGARRLADTLSSVARDVPSASAHTYVLERSLLVKAPVEQVVSFFESPENLALITPKWMRFRILSVQEMPMRPGTRIEYEIRPFGVPQRWTTEIVEHEPGRRFVDIQTNGPYRYWRHEHRFEPIDGTTLMRDRVQYQLPFGPLGRLAHAVAVARQLRAIFDYRTEVIDRLFAGEEPPAE